MCNEKKDFSLLRPFNEEAAKRGESIYTCYEQKLSYQAGPDVRGTIAVLNEHGYMITCRVQDIRMAPLCWVRTSVEDDTLKPVYKGDVLYQPGDSRTFKITGYEEKGGGLGKPCLTYGGTREYVEKFTCTPPKVRRNVCLKCWIHTQTKEVVLRETPSFIYPEIWKRFPQLDTTIEIEE